MTRLLIILCGLLTLACNAEEAPVRSLSNGLEVALWNSAPPHPFAVHSPEKLEVHHDKLIAGKPYSSIGYVSVPTLNVRKPTGKSSKAAILVFPGGGYWDLAIDLEGTEVCDWLIANGVTCVLVKYRVPGYNKKTESRSGPFPDSPIALEDAQRALALTRCHAQEWGIDPHKIGVLGFSAGGHLVAAKSTHERTYKPTDIVDQVSMRPDFGLALYPGHLLKDGQPFQLNPNVSVSSRTPPQFILQSGDDPVDSVNNALVYYIALKKAGVPAEMHLYPEGGHAFGLRHAENAITDWPSSHSAG